MTVFSIFLVDIYRVIRKLCTGFST